MATSADGDVVLEDTLHLLEHGVSVPLVCRQLKRQPGSIGRLLARRGHRDLAALFYREASTARERV